MVTQVNKGRQHETILFGMKFLLCHLSDLGKDTSLFCALVPYSSGGEKSNTLDESGDVSTVTEEVPRSKHELRPPVSS